MVGYEFRQIKHKLVECEHTNLEGKEDALCAIVKECHAERSNVTDIRYTSGYGDIIHTFCPSR